MKVLDVFPSRSHSRLVSIVSEILELESKLSRLEDQSEYFRWAESNHRVRLNELVMEFDVFRDRFKKRTVDDLLEELNAQNEIQRRVVASLAPCMIRRIALSIIRNSVAEVEGVLVLKNLIGCLPSLDELISTPEVLEVILESQ